MSPFRYVTVTDLRAADVSSVRLLLSLPLHDFFVPAGSAQKISYQFAGHANDVFAPFYLLHPCAATLEASIAVGLSVGVVVTFQMQGL